MAARRINGLFDGAVSIPESIQPVSKMGGKAMVWKIKKRITPVLVSSPLGESRGINSNTTNSMSKAAYRKGFTASAAINSAVMAKAIGRNQMLMSNHALPSIQSPQMIKAKLTKTRFA